MFTISGLNKTRSFSVVDGLSDSESNRNHFAFLSCKKFLICFIPLFLSCIIVYAQQPMRVEIVQANSLEGSKIGLDEIRRLKGDVIFRQNNTLMYCDSAIFYEKSNSIDAYGNIRINGPDAKMTGKTLHYDGNTRQAVITQDVQLMDGKMTLTTQALNYNTETDIADYSTGGKVVDHENILTSNKGYYFSKDKMVFFKDKVVLTNPEYIMYSDTLKYHTPSATSYFYGPCFINSTAKDSSVIYCEYGWYNTNTGKSYFSKNAYIQSKSNRLRGDSMLYDRNLKLGEAFKNVEVSDTVQKVSITGDYAYVNEKTNKSFVTGHTQLVKMFDVDSMYMHADTLFAIQNPEKTQKTYYAFDHVRIYKSDLQGKCDSLVYSTADSMMRFYHDPVLWNNANQLTADSISLTLSGNKIFSLQLRLNSLIVSREDTLRFNQVKGRDMTGYFQDNKLYKIHVIGNGQTIYYLRNKKKQITGVNQADCSDLLIFINDNKVEKISLLYKPDATLFPVKETNPLELRLKGYKWLEEMRPKNSSDIFNWK